MQFRFPFLRRAPARVRAQGAAHAGNAVEAKASRAAALVALFETGRPRWTPRDYAQLAREGFAQNPIVYRAVRLIAEAVAALPRVLYAGSRELDTHPLLDLLDRPNPRQSGTDLIEAATGHLLVAGNAYLEAVFVAGQPRELYALRPDRMKVVPGPEGWPEAYEYSVAGRSVRFAMGETPPPILHLTLFNPLDDHYGLSPLEAAAAAVDVHNAASGWNKALLDNAARPSGALVYSAAGNLSEEQFERLKSELETHYQGSANAGRPLLLEGGLDWKALSLSPKDMDFVEAKRTAAREIALAFGVPPMLLGIPGDNTYANYAEANRSFYRTTVVPLALRLFSAITQWLAPALGEVRLAPDLDAIEALASERESLWKRVGEASFLSEDEKREAVGYGVRETGAPGFKYRPDQPRVPAGSPQGGQWTDDEALLPADAQPANLRQWLFNQLLNQLRRPPRVPPGTTIRNKKLAGKRHEETKIPFDEDGFPDFSGVATKTVRVPHTGNRRIDEAAANRAAGYLETPPGMVWHHHQDGYRMLLVPRTIHEKTGHTGSIGIRNTPGKK